MMRNCAVFEQSWAGFIWQPLLENCKLCLLDLHSTLLLAQEHCVPED